jgi:hypothetical protein
VKYRAGSMCHIYSICICIYTNTHIYICIHTCAGAKAYVVEIAGIGLTEMFSASTIDQNGKRNAEKKAVRFCTGMLQELKNMTMSKPKLVDRLFEKFAPEQAKATIKRKDKTSVILMYMGLYAKKLLEDKDALLPYFERDGCKPVLLKDSFQIFRTAHTVARSIAETKDPEHKAMLFQKVVNMSTDFSGIGAPENAAHMVSAGSDGNILIQTVNLYIAIK